MSTPTGRPLSHSHHHQVRRHTSDLASRVWVGVSSAFLSLCTLVFVKNPKSCQRLSILSPTYQALFFSAFFRVAGAGRPGAVCFPFCSGPFFFASCSRQARCCMFSVLFWSVLFRLAGAGWPGAVCFPFCSGPFFFSSFSPCWSRQARCCMF